MIDRLDLKEKIAFFIYAIVFLEVFAEINLTEDVVSHHSVTFEQVSSLVTYIFGDYRDNRIVVPKRRWVLVLTKILGYEDLLALLNLCNENFL